VIDLPYIYSNIQYKYDIYGAQNSLLSSGWKKGEDGIYIKQQEGGTKRLLLTMLVNQNDEEKKLIASSVKEMCERLGIGIEIVTLSEEEITTRIREKSYDIVLASIYLKESPDIRYLEEYLNLNENIHIAMSQVENSSVENLPSNVKNLQNVLSSEVACIGIMARNINVVYQKDILGFENIGYFKVFQEIENIGKIQEKVVK